MKKENLIGKKYGLLTVLAFTDKRNKSGSLIWKCKCDCGNIVELSTSEIKRPERKSCGCLMKKTKDLTNIRFGRLIALKKIEFNKKCHSSSWLCKCDCGNYKIINSGNLQSGRTKSCGCLSIEIKKSRKKHGENNSNRLYRIWKGIKQRCNDDNCHNYKGREITMCKEWQDSYLSFKDWALENGYKDTLSIDRINNNGNYEPNNCRWATSKQQANNTRKTVFLTIKNETKSVSYWSEVSGINRNTILARKRRGWDDYDCVYKALNNGKKPDYGNLI